jgi:hypothetical protein
MSVVQACRALLRLYPSDYRALFALEMQNAFERAAEECRSRGRPVFVRFLIREFIGLLWGAGAEWVAKFTTDSSVRGRCFRDLRMMQLAGAYRSDREGSVPDRVMDAQTRISVLIQRMVGAIANHDFPGARRYSDEERLARDELRWLQRKYGIAGSGNDGCS